MQPYTILRGILLNLSRPFSFDDEAAKSTFALERRILRQKAAEAKRRKKAEAAAGSADSSTTQTIKGGVDASDRADAPPMEI